MRLNHHTATMQGGTLTLTLQIGVSGLAEAAAAEARVLSAIKATIDTPSPALRPAGDMVFGPGQINGHHPTPTPAPARPTLEALKAQVREEQAAADRARALKLAPVPEEPRYHPSGRKVRQHPKGPGKPAAANTRWDDDEDDIFIIEHYGTMNTKKVAAKLGRTPSAVHARAAWLRKEGYPVKRIGTGHVSAPAAEAEAEASPFEQAPSLLELIGEAG